MSYMWVRTDVSTHVCTYVCINACNMFVYVLCAMYAMNVCMYIYPCFNVSMYVYVSVCGLS